MPCNKKKKMNKKGQVVIYIVFIVSALFITVIAAFFAPMGVRFNSEMYAAGEKLMLESNETIQKIQDAEIKAELQGTMDNALGSTQNNIDVLASLYQYGWILVIGASALILFLFTRQLVEFRQGGLV